jgi:hypothetical protein
MLPAELHKSLPVHPALWRGSDLAHAAGPCIASGFHALDAVLPGGGWPLGALTELLPAHEGIGELRVLGPALAMLAARGEQLAWIAPPHQPYGPALAAAGITPASLVIVRTRTARDTLWAAEQALASNACGAVLAWLPEASFTLLRRLQLAAEAGRALALMFRDPRVAAAASPAVLRIALDTQDGGLALRLLKRRGAPLLKPILLPALPGHAPHAVDRTAFQEPAARSFFAQRVLA